MARPQTAQRTAMTPATPTTPIEIETASGELFAVSFEDVRHFISPKATDAECKIFLETCRAYHLNPFTKEAYLIHYDNKNDETPATIVLGKNCYLQMAERHPAFDGFEAGIVVYSEGQIVDREGSILYDGETLLGGWAKVYRKDRTRPGYDEVKFDEYNTGKSMWAAKPATMIRKVALVHALREAFPSTFGLLYDESEIEVVAEGTAREVEEPPSCRAAHAGHPHRPSPWSRSPQQRLSPKRQNRPRTMMTRSRRGRLFDYSHPHRREGIGHPQVGRVHETHREQESLCADHQSAQREAA